MFQKLAEDSCEGLHVVLCRFATRSLLEDLFAVAMNHNGTQSKAGMQVINGSDTSIVSNTDIPPNFNVLIGD